MYPLLINLLIIQSAVCYISTHTVGNTKVTELESKIPSIKGLATTFAFTAFENKIPDISSLVKKENRL